MLRKSLLILPLVLGVVVACGDVDDLSSSSDFATDSFAKPTDHGELDFGVKNPAAFDSQHRFHAWTFELTGDAKVDIRTNLLAENLDSIIYLYKKSASGKWGSYIAKNDDHQGNLWSRLNKTLKKGEYLLKVKAHKADAAGAFEVQAGCTGAGCPVVPSCTDEPLPAETDYTAGCAERLQNVVLGPVDVVQESVLRYSERCSLSPLAARGADYYRQYWESLDIWAEMVEAGEGDVSLTVQTLEHYQGTTVRVDGDGDEDVLSFVFDASGELIAMHHDEQSPTVRWSCAASGEPGLESPDAFCVGEMLGSLAHESDDAREGSGSTTPEEAEYESSLLALAANHFVLAHGFEPEALLDYHYEQWESIGGGREGALVELSHGGQNAAYAVTTGWDDPQVLTLSEDDVVRFVCER